MPNGSRKGSAYERDICTRLSDWWESGRTDIFWRTSQSGGRATTRRKKDKATFGQSGDIAAVDPIGLPFLKMFAVEVKRGYSKFSPFDVIDRGPKMKPQLFQQWVYQAGRSETESKSIGWLIIFKRDRRETMVAMPANLWRNTISRIPNNASHLRWTEPSVELEVIIMPLHTMLQQMTPHMIKKFLQARGK